MQNYNNEEIFEIDSDEELTLDRRDQSASAEAAIDAIFSKQENKSEMIIFVDFCRYFKKGKTKKRSYKRLSLKL